MVPASTPGIASGNSTRRAICSGVAPRLNAASSTERSMPSITLCRVSTMNGRFTAVMPMMTAGSVNMISSGCRSRRAHQARVDHALVAERHHPAGGAHRVADEQRQHHQHDQQVLEAHLRARQHVGERKAQHQADRGGDQRDAHRAREHRVVVDVGEELDVVLDRQRIDHELAGHELVQAVAEQDRERQQDADADIDRRGADQPRRGERWRSARLRIKP